MIILLTRTSAEAIEHYFLWQNLESILNIESYFYLLGETVIHSLNIILQNDASSHKMFRVGGYPHSIRHRLLTSVVLLTKLNYIILFFNLRNLKNA